ncbi:hypothetical protein CSUI_005832, partial [Cystoisospora suis]
IRERKKKKEDEIKRSERRLKTAAGDLPRAAGCRRTGRP